MFLMSRITENKRQQNELNKQKITERELSNLNQKINKLLTKLEEHEQETANSIEEECVICITSKASISTFPCGHCVICRRCFVKTIQNSVSQKQLPLRCVICRAKIIRLKQSFPTNMNLLTETSRSKYTGRRHNRAYYGSQLNQTNYQPYANGICFKKIKNNVPEISSSSSISFKSLYKRKKLKNQQATANQSGRRDKFENGEVEVENIGVCLDSNNNLSTSFKPVTCDRTGENRKTGQLNDLKESINLKNNLKIEAAVLNNSNKSLNDIEEIKIEEINKKHLNENRLYSEINRSKEVELNRSTAEIQLERIEKLKKLTKERSLNRTFKTKILNKTFNYFNARIQNVKYRKEEDDLNYSIPTKKTTWFNKLKRKTSGYLNEIKILFNF